MMLCIVSLSSIKYRNLLSCCSHQTLSNSKLTAVNSSIALQIVYHSNKFWAVCTVAFLSACWHTLVTSFVFPFLLLVRCGPCQYMVPILQEVSEKLGDKIQVVKIDTEKYTSIANRYRIEALPTFIIFKDGKPCHRFVSVKWNIFFNFHH